MTRPSIPRIMHDEVSETENIRKNLAIERMIVEGCEILLDTSQTFVRQGNCCQRAPSCFRSKLKKSACCTDKQGQNSLQVPEAEYEIGKTAPTEL